ncbi:MAG: DAK2 domain-containing protein, partial [Firmicutes bacterium]|nr:DAK2 domain-containing protein [Bacillota bacterium]
TVVREAAANLLEHVEESWTMEKAMQVLLDEAKASLVRTPELLPILKEVGVVDSGGAGLVRILEGFQKGMVGNVIERMEATAFETKSLGEYAGAQMEGEEYGYCTEFILRLGPDSVKKPFVEKRFGSVLNSHGNSIVMVRDEDIVKVHIHTINPGNIMAYAQQFGEFVTRR